MPEAQDNLLPFKVRDRRVPGWHWNQNEIVDLWGPVIGAYGVAIYNVLSRFSRDGEVDELSAPRIARLLKMSRSKVFQTLAALEGNGLLGRKQKPGGESTYLLLDLKAALPVHQVDGLEPEHPSTTWTGPVHHTDGYQDANPSTTRTGPVHQEDGTRPPGGLHKGSKTKDCKTTTPPPTPPGGKELEQANPGRRNRGLVKAGDAARRVLSQMLPQGGKA